MNNKQNTTLFLSMVINLIIAVSLIIYIIAISNSEQNQLLLNFANSLTRYSFLLTALISLLVYDIKKMEIFLYLFLIGISLMTYHHSGDPSIVKFVFLVITFRRFKIKKILSIFLFINISVMIITFFMYCIGKWRDIIVYDSSSIKHSLGFGQPNSLGRSIFVIILLLLTSIAFGELKILVRKKIFTVFIFLVLFIFLYKSGSVSSIIGTINCFILYGIYVMIQKKKNIFFWKNILKILSIFIIAFSLVFSFYFAINDSYSSVLGQKINNLLTGRLYFSHLYFHEYKLNIWGNKLLVNSDSSFGQSYLYLDNGILVTILSFGLIVSVILLTYYLLLVKISFNDDLLPLLIPLISFLVFSVSEKSGLSFYLNFSLYFIPIILENKKNIDIGYVKKWT